MENNYENTDMIDGAGHRRLRGQVLAASMIMALTFCGIAKADVPTMSVRNSQWVAVQRSGESWFQFQLRKFRTYPHYERAQRLISQNKLEEARSSLHKYLEIDPLDTQVRMSYVRLLYQLKKYEEVVQQVQLLQKKDTKASEMLLYRGMALQSLGRAHDAIQDFKTAANDSELGINERLFAANTVVDLSLAEERYADALAVLLLFSAHDHGYGSSYREGIALDGLRRLPEAEAAFQLALRRAANRNDRLRCLNALANTARKRNNLTGTAGYLKAALEMDPNNVRLLRELSQTMYALGDQQQSALWMQKALALEENGHDREFLANLLLARKDYRGAVSEFMRALAEINDNDSRYRIYSSLGYAHNSLKEYAKGSAFFHKAAEIKRTAALNTAILQTEALEKYAERDATIHTLEKTVATSPNADAHVKLGNFYASAGENAKAIHHIEEALRTEADSPLYLELDDSVPIIPDARIGGNPEEKEQKETALQDLGNPGLQLKPAELMLDNFFTSAVENAKAIQRLQTKSQGNDSASLHLKLADLYAYIGENAKSITHLEKAAEGINSAELHFRLGNALVSIGKNAKAAFYLQKALSGNLPDQSRSFALHQLAYLYAQQGKDELASNSFMQAINGGDNGWRTRQDFAFVLMRRRRWEDALAQLSVSQEMHPSPATLSYIGRCHFEMGQHDQAIHYMKLAIADATQLSPAEQKSLYDQLALAYEMRSEYESAAEFLSKSLAIEADPAVALKLGRMQYRLNRIDDAEASLTSPTLYEASPELRADALDALANVYEKKGMPDQALTALDEAEKLRPSASRQYAIGQHYWKLKRIGDAIPHFEAAMQKEPQVSMYRVALAYAHKDKGEVAKAGEFFSSVLEKDLEQGNLYEDAAYTFMQNGENQKAAHWFKAAIDNYSLNAADSADEQQEERLYRMRSEVKKLTKQVEFNVYQSYRSNSDSTGISPVIGPSAANVGVVPSQGGMELLYRPESIGLRDEKVFQVFSRLLWNSFPNSLSINSDSIQGSIGARYKPLKTQNFFVSAERLVKIGKSSDSDWLLRVSYGWVDGYDLKPALASWNYTSFYGDAGYFFGSGVTAIYAEARQGRTFNVSNKLLVTPHITIDTRQQRSDPANLSYVEAGAGVSLKYLFNETRYETNRSSVEFLIQYKRGISSNSTSGWVATLGMQF